MGKLTRRRKIPRIVKKVKPKNKKNISLSSLDPNIRVNKYECNSNSDIGIQRRPCKRLFNV